MVILNSARKGIMNFSFTNDPSLGSGQYYIQASLDLPSFQTSSVNAALRQVVTLGS
jgi:hypothetical protein